MTRVHVLLAAVAAALLVPASPGWGADRDAGDPPASGPVPAAAARVIVEWEAGVTATDRLTARRDADVVFARGLGSPRFQLVAVEPGQTADEAARALAESPDVELALPDDYSTLHAVPNDSLFGQLWGLSNAGGALGIQGFPGPLAGADVDAPAAWDRTVGTPSTVMAIIDSGYRLNHPDLGPVAWSNPADPVGGGDNDGNGLTDDFRGADFVGDDADAPTADGDPTDDDLLTGGHGAHVAGTAGARGNEGLGITGVAQDARIMALRVCANDSSIVPPAAPEARCPSSSQIAAINYAGSHGARVANMSLGGTTYNQAVVNALALNPQTLFVISAGNDAEDNELVPHYPCNYNPAVNSAVPGRIDNVLCVAATDQADQLADFSDWGAASVDLGAPGTETLSAHPTSVRFTETFEVDDFATKWTATGANGGFGRTSEAPLTSFGIGDTPGATVAINTTRESTSNGFSLPAGLGSCEFTQRRHLSVGAGNQYRYDILLNGSPVFQSNAVTASGTISTVPIPELDAGGTVQVRERYIVGATPPSPANGAWIDDMSIRCFEPVGSTVATYQYLDGTSMAAPHATGAAGLLFSLKPSATVAQVKAALLQSVDQVPALAGKTTTGGRLNVAKALDVLSPPVVAATPVVPPPPPVRCKVPKLKGKSLAKAKAALKRARCKLGKVTKPKKRRGRKQPALVVKSSKPKAGTEHAAGRKIAVTLGPKPKPKKRKKR